MAEVKSLAETLDVTLAKAAKLLADDREGYMPPAALVPATEEEEEGTEEGAAGSLLVRGTVDAYVAAIMELWRLQVAHGNGNTDNPCSIAVRGFLKQHSRQRGKLDRKTYKDRGADGIQAGYLPDEWEHIQHLLLSGTAHMPAQNLRTCIDLLFGHYYLLCSENRCKIELADLSLLEYPPSEGLTPYSCLVSLL